MIINNTITKSLAENLDFISQVLSLGDCFSNYPILWENISWRTDKPDYYTVKFFVGCNDLFYWACADCEELTPDNLPRLIQACNDIREAYGVPIGAFPKPSHNESQEEREQWNKDWDRWWHCLEWANALFACRERKMRPQTPYYRNMPAELKPLFDAVGLERTDE